VPNTASRWRRPKRCSATPGAERVGAVERAGRRFSAPGVAENLFGLLHRDAVFGQVLNVSLWVVFQVPDDGGVDHRFLP